MEIDKLDDIYNKQLYLQHQLNADYTTQEYKNMMILALIRECTEALNETKWKSWKKNQVYEQEKYKDELVDCLFFLMNLIISANMDSKELYDRYINKHKINLERIERNY